MKTIIANPPFSITWDADENLLKTDSRFSPYGKLPPKSKADYAFIIDMVHHLDDVGIMAVVLPHGVLFRSAAEGHIRKYLIAEKNCLDAVIGLPANIFFGTSIPTCILVFRKNRNLSDGVLFIDASNEFEKQKNKNNLTIENINNITDVFTHRKIIAKYSYLASMKEIEQNDYNLNIPRYVDTFEEEEEIDIYAVTAELNSLSDKRDKLTAEINGFLKELNLPLLKS